MIFLLISPYFREVGARKFLLTHVLEHLGSALIKSTTAFVNDDSLLSSLNKWQSLWQEAGKDYDEIKIPLEALNAMRLSIEQKSDKPLLRLAKEVRGLVQPLIAKAIVL